MKFIKKSHSFPENYSTQNIFVIFHQHLIIVQNNWLRSAAQQVLDLKIKMELSF